MYSRIVVPLDGSKRAESVLPVIHSLGRAFRSRVLVLRTYSFEALLRLMGACGHPLPGYVIGEMLDKERKSAEQYVRAIALALQQQGLSATFAVNERHAAVSILAESEAEPDTLVVLSSHGCSGVRHVSLGSVASKVLQGSSVPVLLIPTREGVAGDEWRPTDLLVPLDGSAHAAQSLPHAAALACALGLPVTLLRVTRAADWEPPPGVSLPELGAAAQAEAARCLEDARTQLLHQGVGIVRFDTPSGDPSDVILGMARDIPGALIVITSTGCSGVGRWSLGSVAERVVQASARPVLLIRPSAGREPVTSPRPR